MKTSTPSYLQSVASAAVIAAAAGQPAYLIAPASGSAYWLGPPCPGLPRDLMCSPINPGDSIAWGESYVVEPDDCFGGPSVYDAITRKLASEWIAQFAGKEVRPVMLCLQLGSAPTTMEQVDDQLADHASVLAHVDVVGVSALQLLVSLARLYTEQALSLTPATRWDDGQAISGHCAMFRLQAGEKLLPYRMQLKADGQWQIVAELEA